MSKVVITGIGLITPLGVGVKRTWANLIASKSGIVSTSTLPNAEEFDEIPSKVVGWVPKGPLAEGGYDASEHFSPREVRRLAPFIQYAIVATREAMQDADWKPETEAEKERAGSCIGSGIGSFEDTYQNSVALHDKGYRRVQPLLVPRILTNMAAGNVSIYFGLKGPNHAVSTACATGVHCIGDAARFIKDGYADVMVAGASEACVHPLSLAGFSRAKSVVTKFNEDPSKASRPFDKDRAGFVLGEGAGVVVLESLEHAIKRGATDKIYGEVSGYGLSGDATHITSPPENGDGARRAMQMAVERAGLRPGDIGYVNAHATSTLLGDRAENNALKRLFGEERPDLAVSSTKGAIGHLLGAAGSVEAIFATLAMKNRILPPTLNCDHPGEQEEDKREDFIFNYVRNEAQSVPVEYKMDHVVTNSFGFGGTNASLCLSRWSGEAN
ncbi:DEKNAAC103589 [Brettanomyces naardenensis]|uniref:3-oxoacyl-[acyl-carrier-protein] synthase n=1 Tax=Brettanomyces naardenensis TaxID=13370 RepID=A0A448YN07_BRENA|nr:DEKNAAC103589 [Brettanomyces naardenensis]